MHRFEALKQWSDLGTTMTAATKIVEKISPLQLKLFFL
jgi:hypothetical protein